MNVYTDKTFPGVAQVLDVERMRALLEGRLQEMGLDLNVESGRVWDVQYMPHRMCIVLYQFKLRRGENRRTRNQLFTMRLLARDDEWPAQPAGEATVRRSGQRGGWIPVPFFSIPDPRVVVYVYPFDPDLPWMPIALDARYMRRRLNELGADCGWKARSVTIDLLGYTPRMRASFRYRVLCEDRELSLVGKTNAFKPAGKLFAGYWSLWKSGGERIEIPAPVGYFSYPPLTLQETIEGKRLGSLVDAPGFPEVIRKTARLIAAVHGLRIPLLTTRKTRDELRSLDRWSDLLARIRLDHGKRIEALRNRIRREIETRSTILGPVHGDFHHTNVLVDGTKVRLIDLDEMALGDPALDVGRFLASLRVPSLRVFGTIEGLAEARGLFLEEYLHANPARPERIRLFESASLLTAAASAFRIQRSNWQEEVALLLDEAERVFDEATRVRVPRTEEGGSQPDGLPFAEREEWIRDEIYMSAALDRPIQKGFGAHVESVRLDHERKVHGARVLRYRAHGRLGEEKWNATLECTLFEKAGGRRIFLRLARLASSVIPEGDALRLPRPIDYLAPLCLLVVEPVDGRPLTSLLGDGVERSRAARSLGRALAGFHRADLGRANLRPLLHERDLLDARIEGFASRDGEFHRRAAEVQRWLGKRFPVSTDEPGPVFTTLQPHRVLWDGDRPGVADVSRLGLAEPLLDVAHLLAQLLLHGVQEDRLREVDGFGTAFRDAYLEASHRPVDRLRILEAAALLRLACIRREKHPSGEAASKLLERAERRIEGS